MLNPTQTPAYGAVREFRLNFTASPCRIKRPWKGCSSPVREHGDGRDGPDLPLQVGHEGSVHGGFLGGRYRDRGARRPRFWGSECEFRLADTSVETRKPTRAIITTGPYRISRNPIYLSFALLQFGIAVWTGSAWFLVALVLTMIVITTGVILREEHYLERKFGETYLRYKREVRRWL